MTDPDPLDQRLSAPVTGPLPPHAGAVRPRGDRRRRVVLACAAVVAVGTLAGGVALLSGDSGQDALRTAEAPTPTPTCVLPSQFVSFGQDEEVVYSGSYEPYCSELRIVPEPADEEPSVSPAPPGPGLTAASWSLQDALLTPDLAARVELPGWVEGTAPPSAGPLLDPCRDGAFPGDVTERADRAMSSQREAGGSRLVQQVVRYAGQAEAAAAAADAIAAAVASCPEAPAMEGPGTTRFEVAEQGTVQGARTLLVQVQPCGPEGDCTPDYRSYLLLAQVGDGLTDAFYGLAEDGDPLDTAAVLLDAVAEQLARTVVG